jgi:1-acyl-sn-glycerol-3-phosphate acyltransferase
MSAVFSLLCILFILIWLGVRLRIQCLLFGKAKGLALSEHLIKEAARLCLVTVGTFSKARFEFESAVEEPLPGRFLLVANHQSIADIPNLVHFLNRYDFRFIAKNELGRGIPFVSPALRLQEHCLVERKSNIAQSMKAIDDFALKLKTSTVCPMIFPEGTRSRTGEVGTFHTAGFRKLLESVPMPILVVAIDGGYRISNLRRIFSSLRNNRYRTRVLAVLPAPGSKKESAAALSLAHDMIASQVQAWHDEEAMEAATRGR